MRDLHDGEAAVAIPACVHFRRDELERFSHALAEDAVLDTNVAEFLARINEMISQV
jgi:hypothetical protein